MAQKKKGFAGKEFSKNWFKFVVASCEETKNEKPELTLHLLLNDLKNYIAHLDEVDSHRGAKGTCSDKKRAANSINGAKGGWPKGRPRKPQKEPQTK